jgi:transcriptional regulator with XRE-family HTH domain
LRQWRASRRLSQLELASQADVSTKHLSLVENGRVVPSREMVLHLAEQLGVPLRDRNRMLLAAGYAPVYTEMPVDSPALSTVRAAVRQMLAAYEPYPAAVVDRGWNLVEANAGVALFVDGVAPRLLAAPVNVLRLSLDPGGLARRISNLAEWRAHLLTRLRNQIVLTADSGLRELYDELSGYPFDPNGGTPAQPSDCDVVVPLRIRVHDEELAFLSTVTTFGTPLDITVAELTVESFLPANSRTAGLLHRLLPRNGAEPLADADQTS